MSNLLYDALMLGRNKKVENEEFQIASGTKNPASFRTQNEYIEIPNVISDGEFCILLYQEVPGYFEIEVICSDNFIIYDRKVITSDDFIDGRYEFRFMVISDRLHNGRNYSKISFITARQTIDVSVTIDNKIRIRLPEYNPRRRVLELEKLYIDLHLGKIGQKEWAFASLDLFSDDVTGDDEQSLSLMLYKAQTYIAADDSVHARNYIEYVGTQIPKLENKNYDLYCYFIYLASLYEEVKGTVNSGSVMDIWSIRDDMEGMIPYRSEAFHRSSTMDMTALQKVRWVYYHHPSWNILCMLLYMDPYFRYDKKLLLKEMRKLFYDLGEISPVMYMEAMKLFLCNEQFLIAADDFEIQVLNFAVKHDFINAEISERFASLVNENDIAVYDESSKNFLNRLLIELYEKYASKNLLYALCKVLISLDKRGKEYHRYFFRAVTNGLESPEIICYFLYTIDESSMDVLPDCVLKYFTENTELLYEYRKYIYANLIVNKYASSGYYNMCLSTIVKFAERQMLQGQNDEVLTIIYKDILDNKQLTDNMRNNLYDVLCTKKIECDNQRMISVLVFHKELQIYQESLLTEGKAYVKIYTPDALILFKDVTGNLFRKIDFSIDQMINAKEYIDVCIKGAEINRYMLMGDTLPLLRAYKSPVEILEFFTSKKFLGKFRKGYEQELLQNTISYYAKNYKDDEVYDELIRLIEFDMPNETRGILIGIMLKRGLIDSAYDELSVFGTCGLAKDQMAELASEYIRLHGESEQTFLTLLCEEGYESSGFDEYIFNYMYLHYNGSLDMLADIYRSCNVHNKPADCIEERILVKSIKTGTLHEIVPVAFRRYYENGGNRQLINDYLLFRSERYLYNIMAAGLGNSSEDMSFMEYMEKDMFRDTELKDECVIAYLLYNISAEMLDDRQLRNIELHIKDLVRRGKMLEEFKYYRKYFELPSTLTNNIIISAFSENSSERPVISFEISGSGESVKGEEEMEEIFRHCFVKYFTLFYGERVVFSMNGQQSSLIRYDELDVVHDGSRYAELDAIIRYNDLKDHENFYKAVEDFYIKEKLIDYLI